MRDRGVCQGVCGAQGERALFASGAFEVCIACLTSPAWQRERRQREDAAREAEQADARTNIVGRVPLVRD